MFAIFYSDDCPLLRSLFPFLSTSSAGLRRNGSTINSNYSLGISYHEPLYYHLLYLASSMNSLHSYSFGSFLLLLLLHLFPSTTCALVVLLDALCKSKDFLELFTGICALAVSLFSTLPVVRLCFGNFFQSY